MTDIHPFISPHYERITEFFDESAEVLHSETQVICQILTELSVNQSFVSNKDIIRALIMRLEVEQTPINQDILRKALEIVIQKTPNDKF